jgi:type IV pilus assembly protein PilO
MLLNKSYSMSRLIILFKQINTQFRNLDIKNPIEWPLLPRLTIFAAFGIAIFFIFWYLCLSKFSNDLEVVRDEEASLRDSYTLKIGRASSLDMYKKQKIQVAQYVLTLERQLPGKAEIENLLSDINQSGIGRGLQFELFRPEKESIKDYYSEQPISIKVIGSYAAIGAFASDIAHLSRIVTLNNIIITPKSDGYLLMESMAKTFRYLDKEEISENRKQISSTKKIDGEVL